jgi:UDP-glucose 4-epimerase
LATSINPQIAESSPQRVAADYAAFSDFLEGLARHSSPPPVVLLSSGGTVYDDRARPPYDESSPTSPRSAYGKAKLALELQLRERAPRGSVVVRISNAYGPGQPVASGQGVVAHWLRAARREEHLRIFGDPNSSRDYVYVDDVAAAMLAVHRHIGDLPAVINIGSGVPTSLQALAETVLDVVGDSSLGIEVEEARTFDVHSTWLDVTLADTALGWRSRTSLHDGLAAAWSAVSRLGDPQQ